MIFKRALQSILFLLFSLFCQAQTDSLTTVNKTSSDVRMSYNSSLIYPGIRLGVELPFYKVYLTKNTNGGKFKLIEKDRFISANAGWYHHNSFHDNIYLTIEWTMRRTRKTRFFTEFSSGLGFSRTFLGATTYHVDNNGDVSILKRAGYDYAMLIAGGGFGFDFTESRRMPFSIFCKVDMLMMVPYNSTLYFRPAMELGVIYKPVSFIQLRPKIRKVTK